MKILIIYFKDQDLLFKRSRCFYKKIKIFFIIDLDLFNNTIANMHLNHRKHYMLRPYKGNENT